MEIEELYALLLTYFEKAKKVVNRFFIDYGATLVLILMILAAGLSIVGAWVIVGPVGATLYVIIWVIAVAALNLVDF